MRRVGLDPVGDGVLADHRHPATRDDAAVQRRPGDDQVVLEFGVQRVPLVQFERGLLGQLDRHQPVLIGLHLQPEVLELFDPCLPVVGRERHPARAPAAARGSGQLGGTLDPLGFVVGVQYYVLHRAVLLARADGQDPVVVILDCGPAPRYRPPGLPAADEFLTISH
ncbi:MAG: hypothetical protein QOH03_3783 [Kribbellaceae bacterium]|nr:hypothetical protein [Kribbellaceae bacterium]